MKLTPYINIRLSGALLIVLAMWSSVFYYMMIDEINDETDDSLENYAEVIIIKHLAGEPLPDQNDGSNNSYYLREVTVAREDFLEHQSFKDSMIYIDSREEEEPARILRQHFVDEAGKHLELMVATPTFERDDLRKTILIWTVALYLLIASTVIIVNFILFRMAMKPFHDLTNWLEHHSIGKKSVLPRYESHVTEFEQLYRTIDAYQNRSEELYEQQREFIGNASHEMQTPLAVVLHRIDNLLDNENFTSEEIKELIEMRKTIQRLSRINRTLLLLTKIENNQFPDKSDIEFKHLISEAIEQFEEIYGYKQITVTTKFQDCETAQLNESLASVLIDNLIKNAFVHTPEHGSITIELNGQQLLVSNSGTEPLDSSRIFERFYQSKEKSDSTGLGLSLVNAVCRLYHYPLTYAFKNGNHLFSIQLKKKFI